MSHSGMNQMLELVYKEFKVGVIKKCLNNKLHFWLTNVSFSSFILFIILRSFQYDLFNLALENVCDYFLKNFFSI